MGEMGSEGLDLGGWIWGQNGRVNLERNYWIKKEKNQ